MAKCPSCQKPIMNPNVTTTTLKGVFNTTDLKGIMITCPMCQTILGAQVDPIALAADIAGRVKRG